VTAEAEHGESNEGRRPDQVGIFPKAVHRLSKVMDVVGTDARALLR
jgi:hypothetical protein